jgi:hypothetical protein
MCATEAGPTPSVAAVECEECGMKKLRGNELLGSKIRRA